MLQIDDVLVPMWPGCRPRALTVELSHGVGFVVARTNFIQYGCMARVEARTPLHNFVRLKVNMTCLYCDVT